jgi:PAS domain S-box-containing protein
VFLSKPGQAGRGNLAPATVNTSDGTFRALFEAALEGIFVFDSAARCIDVNPAICELLRYTREELLGLTIWDFIPAATLSEPRRLFTEGIATGRLRGEFKGKKKDGTLIDIEYQATANIVPGVHVGFIRDITNRRPKEDGVARLAAIVQSSNDAIISTDLNGIIQSWNPGAERTYRYSASEAIGQHISLLAPPDKLDEVRDLILRGAQGEQIDYLETVRRRKDGRNIKVSVSLSPVHDASGQLICISRIARDTTEQTRANEELHKHQKLLQTIFDEVPVMICVFDSEGRYLALNREFKRVYGWALEGGGSLSAILARIFPNVQEQARSEECIRTANGTWEEFPQVDEHGRRKVIRWAMVRLSDGRTMGIGRDISEQKRAEEAAEARREALEAKVEEALGTRESYRLTFRELSVLHLVAEGVSDKEIAEVLGISIRTAQNHLSRILEKMGAASRTEAGVRAVREGIID